MIGLVCGGAGATAAVAAGWAVRGRSSAVFAPSVYRGATDRRSIALTFDDGPSESTPELLRILAGHSARATFFQCGAHVVRLPEVARAVSEAGHEIGNHTHTHPHLWLRNAAFIAEEVGLAQEALERVHGTEPRLFRAPYGVRWPGLRNAQAQHRLLGVMWTTIALDWKLPAGRIVSRLLRNRGSGAIFCLHDGRRMQPQPDIESTVESVRRLLPLLLEDGYRLETVSEILCPKT
ncbi:MAG: polysaccharide deacetylase family protein [Acidobacteriia bacterium]|nr:polysaccharide deacetylase family protein [Terriglobia bacterium]